MQETTKTADNTKADLIRMNLYIPGRFSKSYMISFERQHLAVARTVAIKAKNLFFLVKRYWET